MEQLFNLSIPSFQLCRFFCTFLALSCIFISHKAGSVQKRDELSHAWLFEPSGVNVINVHGCNAELFYGWRENTGPGQLETCNDLLQGHAAHTRGSSMMALRLSTFPSFCC